MVSLPWHKDRGIFIPHVFIVRAQTILEGIEIHRLNSNRNHQFSPLHS